MNLSEEEIIKNIKEMIQWSDHNTYKMALQGLLDLYNREKESDTKHLAEIGQLRTQLHAEKEKNTLIAMEIDRAFQKEDDAVWDCDGHYHYAAAKRLEELLLRVQSLELLHKDIKQNYVEKSKIVNEFRDMKDDINFFINENVDEERYESYYKHVEDDIYNWLDELSDKILREGKDK